MAFANDVDIRYLYTACQTRRSRDRERAEKGVNVLTSSFWKDSFSFTILMSASNESFDRQLSKYVNLLFYLKLLTELIIMNKSA